MIARAVLGDLQRWPEIASLNGLREPYTIFPGQVLSMPGGALVPEVQPPKRKKGWIYLGVGAAIGLGWWWWQSR